MNLAIDIGNTAVKWATFEGRTMMESGKWRVESGEWRVENGEWRTESGERRVENIMVCASGDATEVMERLKGLHAPLVTLHADTALPIKLDYKTPASLGPDRIAAACGAWALHRGEDCLVVDAGTCITVDFLDREGVYHGGAIMPGLGMNLQALHTFTAKLPLISLEGVEKAPVLGRTTEESIVAGTLGATMLALAGYVALYRQRCPQLCVLLSGGDAARLTAAGATGWELQPQLTLIGLNEIMTYHEE